MNRSTLRRYALHVLSLVVFAAGLVALPAQAQDKNAHKKQFNKGLKSYKQGTKSAKAGNNTKAMSQFKKAVALMEKAAQSDDASVTNKAKQYGAQMAYGAGRIAVQQKDFEDALQQFQKGIQLYPKYAKNYRGKGLALKKMKRIDEAMAAYGKAIEVGENNGDYDTASKAETGIRQYYIYQASQLLSSENPSTSEANQALEHLGKIEQYVDPGAKAYYYMAVAHNTKGNYDQAVSYADQALSASTGSRSDKARVYFEKGKALMKSGAQGEACGAFRNARYGDVKSRAKYNMKKLECMGTSSS